MVRNMYYYLSKEIKKLEARGGNWATGDSARYSVLVGATWTCLAHQGIRNMVKDW